MDRKAVVKTANQLHSRFQQVFLTLEKHAKVSSILTPTLLEDGGYAYAIHISMNREMPENQNAVASFLEELMTGIVSGSNMELAVKVCPADNNHHFVVVVRGKE